MLCVPLCDERSRIEQATEAPLFRQKRTDGRIKARSSNEMNASFRVPSISTIQVKSCSYVCRSTLFASLDGWLEPQSAVKIAFGKNLQFDECLCKNEGRKEGDRCTHMRICLAWIGWFGGRHTYMPTEDDVEHE